MTRYYYTAVTVCLVLGALFVVSIMRTGRVRQQASEEELAIVRLSAVCDVFYDGHPVSLSGPSATHWARVVSGGADEVVGLTLTSHGQVVIGQELALLRSFGTPLALSIVPPLTVSNDALLLLREANIVGLGLNGQPVNGRGLQHVGNISSLEYLFLNDTLVSDDDLRHLVALPKLRVLFLDGTTISDNGIRHLQQLDTLEELGLSRTGITDTGVCKLRHLHALTYLAIADTAITDHSLHCIRRHHPRLETLIVDDTDVTESGVAQVIKNMKALDYISIKGTAVAPADARRLRKGATHITTMHADWD